MTPFTPFSALAGGALVGLASVLVLAGGRIAGISGICGGIFSRGGERGWRLAFLTGLFAGGVLLASFAPKRLGQPNESGFVIALAGVLVGLGTQIGGGCTSGHGVCGISRLSKRSVVATFIFVGVAMATATLKAKAGAP